VNALIPDVVNRLVRRGEPTYSTATFEQVMEWLKDRA
jgi:hypothetical protein